MSDSANSPTTTPSEPTGMVPGSIREQQGLIEQNFQNLANKVKPYAPMNAAHHVPVKTNHVPVETNHVPLELWIPIEKRGTKPSIDYDSSFSIYCKNKLRRFLNCSTHPN
ncbi:hypothetical protein PCANC_20296 [Puccinia coronata f. sp. avenae]|uniref:Uncharacterized protein n=1 Tax=Puccinia coronata f. sp. avenae TaxID=200324 RepID=A0A2N5UMH7_9BASI|nr:hypothetical protein PCANC_20296 [Puccinia coronata f. sp. avenae]